MLVVGLVIDTVETVLVDVEVINLAPLTPLFSIAAPSVDFR